MCEPQNRSSVPGKEEKLSQSALVLAADFFYTGGKAGEIRCMGSHGKWRKVDVLAK